jgi:hypothetical protein
MKSNYAIFLIVLIPVVVAVGGIALYNNMLLPLRYVYSSSVEEELPVDESYVVESSKRPISFFVTNDEKGKSMQVHVLPLYSRFIQEGDTVYLYYTLRKNSSVAGAATALMLFKRGKVSSFDSTENYSMMKIRFGGSIPSVKERYEKVIFRTKKRYSGLWVRNSYVINMREANNLNLLKGVFPNKDLSKISSDYCLVELTDESYRLLPVVLGVKGKNYALVDSGVNKGAMLVSVQALKLGKEPKDIYQAGRER